MNSFAFGFIQTCHIDLHVGRGRILLFQSLQLIPYRRWYRLLQIFDVLAIVWLGRNVLMGQLGHSSVEVYLIDVEIGVPLFDYRGEASVLADVFRNSYVEFFEPAADVQLAPLPVFSRKLREFTFKASSARITRASTLTTTAATLSI